MTPAHPGVSSIGRPRPAAGLASLTTWLIAAAVFLAPYTVWRLEPDTLFTISDALFSLALLLMLCSGRINGRPFGDLTTLWLLALAIMLLAFLVSSIFGPNPARWKIVAGQYCFCFALLPMLLMSSERRLALLNAKALLSGLVAMELAGAVIYAMVGGSHQATQWINDDFITGAHRLGAFMADANWNAAMISMSAPFLLYLARIGRLGPVSTYGGAATIAAGLLLSGSVTGFASTTIAVVIFLVVSGGRGAVRMAAGLATLAALAFFFDVGLPTAFETRVQGAIASGDLSQAGTYVGRMELIKEAWEIVDGTMLIGLGVDQYRVISADAQPVHNMYLLVWAEGGLFALLGWLVMMAVPVIASIRALYRDRVTAALGLAVIVPFLIFSTAAPHMYSRSWVVPLLVAMGLVLARERIRGSRRPSLRGYPVGISDTYKAPAPPP